jgi:GntR family transcriptional regulator
MLGKGAMILDRHSAVPLYYQIQQQLLEQIQSGQLSPGQPLPSEHEISTRLSVSRMTARQALKHLCDAGFAYSRSGLGTFVSGIKQEKTSSDLLSFTQEMKARGCRPSSRLLSSGRVAAEADVAQALHLRAGAKVFCLRRVRLADAVAMGLETSFLPLTLYPGLLENFDPRKSLYQTLADRYKIRMLAADEVVEAALANSDQAKLLGIKKNAPVFRITRVSYAQNGQPVEFVRSTYRGDRWKIVSRLLTSHDAAGGRAITRDSITVISKNQVFPDGNEDRSTSEADHHEPAVSAKRKQEEL